MYFIKLIDFFSNDTYILIEELETIKYQANEKIPLIQVLGCPVPGIFQVRALAWGAISFSEIFTTVTIIFITMFLIIIIYKSAQEPQGERVLEWLIVIMFHSMILK